MNHSAYSEFLRRALFLPPEASSVAPELDHLHFFVILTTIATSLGIGLTALYFFVRYRYRGDPEIGQTTRPGPWFEIAAVGVPLGAFLLWFFMGIHQYLEIVRPPPGSMEIYVVAKKWMWKFAYPSGPNAIETLRVPVGRPVRLLMTSRDVIHSFYVPAFRLKKDILPGRYTELWFTAVEAGTYDIFCSQYCGTGHSHMRGEVLAMRPEDYDAWLHTEERGLALQQDSRPSPTEHVPPSTSMATEGQRVAAEKGCLKCHTITGEPHIGPTWLGLYGRHELLDDGRTVDVDEPYLTESMMDPGAKIVAGFAPVMPSFLGKLSAAETAALVEYIKQLTDPQLSSHPAEGPVYELDRGR